MSFVLRTAVPAAALLVVLVLSTPLLPAQQAGLPATRPATPGAAPVAAESAVSAYRSAFDGYRGFTDQPVESWRQANDEVGPAAGRKTDAREGQGAAALGGHDPAMPAGHGRMAMPMRPAAESRPSGPMAPMPMPPAASRSAPSTAAATSPATPAAAASAAGPSGHAGHRMP